MAKVTVEINENQSAIVLDKEDVAALKELLHTFSAPSTILRSLSNRYALISDPETIARLSTLHLRGFGGFE